MAWVQWSRRRRVWVEEKPKESRMTTITRITKFATADGQEFLSVAEAKAHETKVETRKMLKEILDSGLSTGRVEGVLDVMVLHAAEVRDALTAYLRKQPKKPKQ